MNSEILLASLKLPSFGFYQARRFSVSFSPPFFMVSIPKSQVKHKARTIRSKADKGQRSVIVDKFTYSEAGLSARPSMLDAARRDNVV